MAYKARDPSGKCPDLHQWMLLDQAVVKITETFSGCIP